MSTVETKQIYVVTAGSYSDYGIVGVFDDRELAELASKSIRDGNDVEVYGLNPDAEKYRAGLARFLVWIKKDGNVRRVTKGDGGTRFTIGTVRDPEWSLSTAMWAKGCEHAIKIANERRSYLLAENLWPERSINPHGVRFPWEECHES